MDVGFLTIAGFVAFCAWTVIYADFRISKFNMNVPWNGHGALEPVLMGIAKTPMQHRVLVPWLTWCLSRLVNHKDRSYPYLAPYLWIKWTSVLICMGGVFAFFRWLGYDPFIGTSLFALYCIISTWFDYGETYFEACFFMAAFWCLSNGLSWGMVLFACSFVAALNKETAVFIPVMAVLAGNIPMTTISAVGVIGGRLMLKFLYGNPERYTPLIEKTAWKRFVKSIKDKVPWLLNGYVMFIVMFVGITFLTIHNWSTLTPFEGAMILMFYLSIPVTVLCEIRIWTSVMLAVIPMVMRSYT